MEVTCQYLKRSNERRHPHGHAQHLLGIFRCVTAQQMPSACRAHHKCGSEIGGQCHVNKAVGEAGVKDNSQPINGHKLPYLIDFVSGWRMHPTVNGQNPGGRQDCPERHHTGCREMQPFTHALHAKQHDA